MTSPADDFSAAQAAEYSQYVAVAAIDYGGARAYNIGDPVPASNVELHGYLDAGLVRKTSDLAPELAPVQQPAPAEPAVPAPAPAPAPAPQPNV